MPKQDVRINVSKTETEPKSETKTVVEPQQNNNDTTEIINVQLQNSESRTNFSLFNNKQQLLI